MDGNNWRAANAQVQIPVQVMGGEPVAAAGMEGGDWRAQLQHDSRERVVNKIIDTLRRHLPYSGQEGQQELQKIAVRFEEKIYMAATSQPDYLRKISMKLLTMESKSQSPMADSMQPCSGSNPQDPASQSMQPQIQNQVQHLPLPMVSNQSQVRQQLLPQNAHNNIALNGVSNSVGFSSALSTINGTLPNVPGPNASIQNKQSLPNIVSNAIGNSMGQIMPPNTYSNAQRQIQGRQQTVVTQEQPQQSQGSHHYVYNQQPFVKPTFQPGGVPQQSMMNSQVPQQHQQNLMQTNQLQSSQQAVMQSSLRQASSPPSSSSSTLQNQQSSLQLSSQSMLQQPSQSVIRQHQQQNSMTQHSMLSLQQQQKQHSAQQPNGVNIQPNQLIGQQGTAVDSQQQQRMISQQNCMPNVQQQHGVNKPNNLPSLQQQQSVVQQNNLPNMHQQQLGSQNNLSGFQQQQMKPMQLSMTNMMPNQLQPPQSQPMQHQLMSQPQRVIGEPQLNSSPQMGNTSGGDWQEELYQKIKSLHDTYYHDVNDVFQRLASKLQQHDSIPQAKNNDQLEKLRVYKMMFERILVFLRISKNEVQLCHKDKIANVENQILTLLKPDRTRKSAASLQIGQLSQPHMLAMQQQQTQISQMHMSESHMNSQMRSLNGQVSVVNNLSNLQHNSLSSAPNVSNSRQNMMNALQPGSSVEIGQGNSLSQMQQVSLNSVQQNPVSGPQQMNITSMTSQTGMTTLVSAVNSLQANSNMLQGQQIKQEPQMFSNQQLKQQYQPRLQQQYIQRHQQMIQQQHQLQSQKQIAHMAGQQMAHLNQMSDANDVKLRHQISGKSGILQSHSSAQQPAYHHPSFSIPGQQVLQVASPQIPHHSSPQIEQQNVLASHTKVGTPLQSANSPFVVPSPATSVAPSSMPGDSEKNVSSVPSFSNAGNNVDPPTSVTSLPNQSLAIGTPGISASPLLSEFTNPDVMHGGLSNIVAVPSNVERQPLDRLINAVKSLSPDDLSASINDISSVVSLTDRIAWSAPGNGSRAAMGEDLVAMTKCSLQFGNVFSKDVSCCTKRMKRYTTAMTSNIVSCTGNMNESSKNASANESHGRQFTGASCTKKRRMEANNALEEELREINMRLIDTSVHISYDVNSNAVASAAECAEGTVVKCSFSGVCLGPNFKSQFSTAQMSPIQPLKLLIPKNYPICSPVLLDKFPTEVSKEYEEDLSMMAKSRFSISLRKLTQPMSLGDIVQTWDQCARSIISEYAETNSGGTFSSKYGTWEKCLTAA